jgi:hypothetical protein
MTIILTKAEVNTAILEYLSDRFALKLKDDKGKSITLANHVGGDFEILVDLELHS